MADELVESAPNVFDVIAATPMVTADSRVEDPRDGAAEITIGITPWEEVVRFPSVHELDPMRAIPVCDTLLSEPRVGVLDPTSAIEPAEEVCTAAS